MYATLSPRAGDVSDRDNWGRQRPVPVSGATGGQPARRGVGWALLRALVFVPGALLALGLTFVLGHSGLHPIVFFANLCLVSAAVVCWIQAYGGKGGDRWTLGYLAALGLDYLFVATAVAMLR